MTIFMANIAISSLSQLVFLRRHFADKKGKSQNRWVNK